MPKGTMVTYYSSDDLARLRREGVIIDLPEWLFGGDPGGIAGFAGWAMERTETGWLSRNLESVTGEAPQLLSQSHLGVSNDPGDPRGYERLLRLSPYDAFTPANGWDAATNLHEAVAEKSAQHPLESMMTSFRLLMAATPTAAALPALASEIMGDWIAGDAVPGASLHLIEVKQRLGNRFGMPRALLHTERPDAGETETAFASSLDLMQDTLVGLSAYIEPLVTSLSPQVWGVTAPRAGGVLILNLGEPVRGRRGLVRDIISMAGRGSAPEPAVLESESPAKAFRETIAWWVSRLDLIFSHLTEPSNYSVQKRYSAAGALERILNFEQICRSCQSIATVEDDHVKRLALFHVLNSLEGLATQLDWRELTKLSANEKLLDEIRSRMPASVQAVLMPRAVAAVQALREVQDGFFLPTRLTPDGIRLPEKSGREVAVPLATAASEWLRVIRNSQHGYEQTPSPRTRALLASHSGKIPARLPDLAWLNLLRILVFPELLQRHSYR
jgi:hypothetical protein